MERLGSQLQQLSSECELLRARKAASHQRQEPVTNEMLERMHQQEDKLNQLKLKRIDVDKNVGILRNFLKTVAEEI